MSAQEETTRLEFICNASGQTYEVDGIILVLTTEGYNNNSENRKMEDRGNTTIIIDINNQKELNEQHCNRLPYQCLRLNFRYHFATPFRYHKDWIYDLTLKEFNQERQSQHLEPDFFRVTQDDHWVIVEWLSYTRRETYGGASTSDSPDGLMNSLAIPTNMILSVQATKDRQY
jgi:hypothetical protein